MIYTLLADVITGSTDGWFLDSPTRLGILYHQALLPGSPAINMVGDASNTPIDLSGINLDSDEYTHFYVFILLQVTTVTKMVLQMRGQWSRLFIKEFTSAMEEASLEMKEAQQP